MDKFDYTEAQFDANQLIDEFGESASFARIERGEVNQATGETGPDSTVLLSGVVTPVLRFATNEVNGESVRRDDGYVFFYGSPIKINDSITINGELWRAVDIIKLQSVGGVLVYQKVQLRR